MKPAVCVMLCRWVGIAGVLFHGGCNDHTGTLGAYFGDASADLRIEGPRCGDLTLPSQLPLPADIGFADLPATLPLGVVNVAMDFADNLGAIPAGWSLGAGSYSASLSEFGAPGVSVESDAINLIVKPKDAPTEGSTDRLYWGGELSSSPKFGTGVFVAKVRNDGWQAVQSSFFFANDYIDALGNNLGWSGAILEFTHDGQRQRLSAIIHESSTGRHDAQTVQLDVSPTRFTTLALVALPSGQVGFYVDGQRLWEIKGAQLPPMLSFRFTHWINGPAANFKPSPTPVVFSLDVVAHYKLTCAY
ncbi:MAG: hypothetical protein SF187_29175 [Deltaproteobacteria bacterium]|nr:hypothetical protein [Deltaproteobacteria bacterium]